MSSASAAAPIAPLAPNASLRLLDILLEGTGSAEPSPPYPWKHTVRLTCPDGPSALLLVPLPTLTGLFTITYGSLIQTLGPVSVIIPRTIDATVTFHAFTCAARDFAGPDCDADALRQYINQAGGARPTTISKSDTSISQLVLELPFARGLSRSVTATIPPLLEPQFAIFVDGGSTNLKGKTLDLTFFGEVTLHGYGYRSGSMGIVPKA
jgi:hypothetical protein